MTKTFFQGAFLTVLTLFGGLATGFVLGTTLYSDYGDQCVGDGPGNAE